MRAIFQLTDEELRNMIAEKFGVNGEDVRIGVEARGRIGTGIARAVGARPFFFIEQSKKQEAEDTPVKAPVETDAKEAVDTKTEDEALPFTVAQKETAQEAETEKGTSGGHGSRIARMFGSTKKKSETEEPGEDEEEMEPRPDKGFLIIKCPTCKEVKSFFLRDYTMSGKCYNCQTEYALDSNKLRPAFARCPSCENTIKYRTNLTAESLEVPCKNCGAPIDLYLNKRGTAYVPVGE